MFDLCGNFDYFNQDVAEVSQRLPDSLTTRLVKQRLELSALLTATSDTPDADRVNLQPALLDTLHQHVATMPQDNFLVRKHLRQAEEFAQRERWEQLSEDDRATIAEQLAQLPNGLPSEDALAKRFDLLCLKLQLAILKQGGEFVSLRDKLRDAAAQLEQKRDIPMVTPHLPLIAALQDESWWCVFAGGPMSPPRW